MYIYIAVPGIKLRAQSGHEDRSVYPEYKSLVGGKAELPCNVTLPTPEDAITLILWYRGDNRTPIYTVDARDNPGLNNARHFASADVFQLNTRPALLKIDPVREDDDHEYRCRVDFRWGRTMSTFVRLSVIVPPKKVIIKDELGRPLHDLIGPFNEDTNLRLLCEAEGGKPPPSLIWYRYDDNDNNNNNDNNIILDDTYSYSIDNKTIFNDLLIMNLSRADLMARFVCMASNPNLTAPIKTSVQLDINLKPNEIRLNSLDSHLTVGNSVELVCRTSGSRPPALISWFKDNRPLSYASENTVTIGNWTTSTVTYKPGADDHGVYVSCRSENQRLANSSIESGFKLNVYFIPQLSLMISTNTKTTGGSGGSSGGSSSSGTGSSGDGGSSSSSGGQHVVDGDEIFMKCQISANPGVFINNSSLVVKSVRRQHSGRYQCFANNSEGRGHSQELTLVVNYAPVCRSHKRVFGAAIGETMTIGCEVDAQPPDVTFQWSVNANSQQLLGNYQQSSTGSLGSTLTYIPKTKRDFGQISCRATNSVGQQQDPCIFSIVAAGLPGSPTSCLVVNQTSTDITVDCIGGDDGGLDQLFHLELYDSDDIDGHQSVASNRSPSPNRHRLVANLSRQYSPAFRLTDLMSGTQYLAIIYASNAKGRSLATELTVPTLALLNKKFVADVPHTDDISAVLAVALGLGLVVVLVVIILVIICKIRSNNRRKESSSVSSTSTTEKQYRDRRLSDNSDMFADNSSKEDLRGSDRELMDTLAAADRKNPDVIPPIDGYALTPLSDRQSSASASSPPPPPPPTTMATTDGLLVIGGGYQQQQPINLQTNKYVFVFTSIRTEPEATVRTAITLTNVEQNRTTIIVRISITLYNINSKPILGL
ncbi:nephrin-like [Oppia nitens]|uniref:nephrin-like n=1 Tax=Oppia nitens TaxID=1686743 RepID=UPI0023DB389A|nr:nephrin-like [Oppia nitens]